MPSSPQSPVSESFHLSYINSVQKGQSFSRISTSDTCTNDSPRHICIFVSWLKTLYDCCQHQSFSSSPNKISAVSVPTHINCIELPVCVWIPLPATSRRGAEAVMGAEGVVADERRQESGHSGWLSEDVMWAWILQWCIAAGGRRGEDGQRRKTKWNPALVSVLSVIFFSVSVHLCISWTSSTSPLVHSDSLSRLTVSRTSASSPL